MKVVVDEMPQKPIKCLFAKYCADGIMQCKLTEGGQMCRMEFGLECDKLKEEDGKESE